MSLIPLVTYMYPYLRIGLSGVFKAVGQSPFCSNYRNCQRAIYIRGIAASQLGHISPSFTELVLVGRKGKRKRIWGLQETKVIRAGSKRIYQDIGFFRNLRVRAHFWPALKPRPPSYITCASDCNHCSSGQEARRSKGRAQCSAGFRDRKGHELRIPMRTRTLVVDRHAIVSDVEYHVAARCRSR